MYICPPKSWSNNWLIHFHDSDTGTIRPAAFLFSPTYSFLKLFFLPSGKEWKLLGNIWSQRAEFCTENGWVEIKYCVSCLGIREARACFLGFLQSYDKIYGPFFWPKTKGGENFPSSASFNSEETPSDGYGLVLHIPSGVH